MRSQFSNRQKLNFIHKGIADYIQKVKDENDRLYALIAQDQFNFAKRDYNNFREEYFKDGRMIIKRQELQLIILDKLDCAGVNTVCRWINKTLSSGLLSMNPTSSLSAIKGIYKPTPDSRYFINNEKFMERDTSISDFG